MSCANGAHESDADFFSMTTVKTCKSGATSIGFITMVNSSGTTRMKTLRGLTTHLSSTTFLTSTSTHLTARTTFQKIPLRGCYKTLFARIIRNMVTLSQIFERHVLKHASLLCPAERTGRPRALTDKEAFAALFKVARTGMQWREIHSSVSYATVFRRVQSWAKVGVVMGAYRDTLRTYNKLVPTRHYCIDSSFKKNVFGRQCVGRNHTDRGRLALKLTVVTDQAGVVYGMRADPGNRNDVILLQRALESMLTSIESLPIYADRGYDSKANRRICDAHSLRDRIFRRKTKTTRKENAKRVVVEHTFAWLQQYRRLLLFYEQTPTMYLLFAFVALGNILGNRVAKMPASELVCSLGPD
jgi:transposase